MKRRSVYVVGAGFSAGLGYPLTHDLLSRLWERIDGEFKRDLKRVVRFHHPGFNSKRFQSFPNIEQLLSEMVVNDELFDASRQYDTHFTREKLQELQQEILLRVAEWFHDLSKSAQVKNAWSGWLEKFRVHIADEDAVVISFNWDLILDRLLFGEKLTNASYGFGKRSDAGPILLKPHGSLNWFRDSQGRYIKEAMRFPVIKDEKPVYAFKNLTRAPRSSRRDYLPLIIPPVYVKKFDAPVFRSLWQYCTSAMSTARKVVFLGYSMPSSDLHAQFILRCGFHNQIEGEPAEGLKRNPKTGAVPVIIVNPDRGAAERTAAVAGPESKCTWVSAPVADWVENSL